MAEIKPFRGLRYNEEYSGDIDKLVAPPYDVVNKKERDALVHAEPLNIFSLELPDTTDGGMDSGLDKYEHSGKLLEEWKRKHILKFDEKPSIYPYEIEFMLPEDKSGEKFIRRGIIVAIRTEEWSDKIILPHEKTFNKVTDDRLKLLEATNTQFSPIFMLYRHNPEANRIITHEKRKILLSSVDSAGNRHTLYRIDDPATIRRFCDLFKDTPLYIADGHHRYTTALRFRKEMEKKYGPEAAEKYGYVMAYLADVEDSGMIVLPTHRILSRGIADLDSARDAISQWFDIDPVKECGLSPEQTVAVMEEKLGRDKERPAVGCITDQGKTAEIWWIKPGYEEILQGEDAKKELSCLDVVILNNIVFRQLDIDPHKLEAGRDIRYEAEAVKAISGLQEGEIMFFMRPTPAHQVLDVADAGLVMPHKSTFFYPKILSGLVLNDMDVPNN